MVQAHVLISGFVQGVGFRHFTQRKAEEIGITGWVQNLQDGRVEGFFVGEKERINKMIELCHKGPFGAKVDSVEVQWEQTKREFKTFVIR